MIQKPCKLFSNAKINLTLDITGTDGGYHTLDSLAVEIDLGNEIEAVKTNDGEISIEFVGNEYEIPSVPANETNAYKAAKLFAETFHTGGAKITVYSVIPVGAGLGSSSADAAGVLRAMRQLYLKETTPEIEEKILKIADMTGSDTRMMYLGGAVRMKGRGDVAESLPLPPSRAKEKKGLFSFFRKEDKRMMYFLLICPLTPVSTPQCFCKYDELEKTYPPRTQDATERFLKGDVYGLGRLMKNDLQEAACALNPDVKNALEAARKLMPIGLTMTGSGSTVVAMFDTAEKRRYALEQSRKWQNNYWVIDTDSVF